MAPSFLISALSGGEWSASHPRSYIPEERALVHTGWAPQPVWTPCLCKETWKSCPTPAMPKLHAMSLNMADNIVS
jgi:hypothetical protein